MLTKTDELTIPLSAKMKDCSFSRALTPSLGLTLPLILQVLEALLRGNRSSGLKLATPQRVVPAALHCILNGVALT